MFAKNDEEKRNVLWRTAMTVSSLLLVLIAVFFLVRMFTANPLEGVWSSEDSDLTLTIGRKDKVTVEWPEKFGEENAAVQMNYSIDLETKTFALQKNEEAVKSAVKQSKGALTTEAVGDALDSLEATYDYNMEQNQLTLTDREYGEQLVFDKK